MRQLLRVMVAALFGLGWTGPRRRAGLSDPSDHHDRAVPRRRGDRHACPLSRRADAADPGADRHHREHRRRRRHASASAARCAPPADGYTLSIGTSTTHMLTGGLYALPFDLLKDLEPIMLIGSEPLADRRQEELAGGRSEGADRLAQGQSRQGVGGHRRRRRHRPARRNFVPEVDRNQIPVRAVSRQRRRRCRICWRDRSIS